MELDQGSDLSRYERSKMWQDAHVKSVRLLVDRKLWPKSVRIPDGIL